MSKPVSADSLPAGLAGVVLAGGRSTRFGSDKASALLAGRPLLDRVVESVAAVCDPVVVVRARGQALPALSPGRVIRIVDDVYEERGPLAGLVAAFERLGQGPCFATSCDVPLLQPRLIRALAALAGDYDVVCPTVGGFPQPLVAVYRVERCLPGFRSALESGGGSITAAFATLRVRRVPEAQVCESDRDLHSFRNANTPAALVDIARIEDAQSRI